jgi:hypothetical protein
MFNILGHKPNANTNDIAVSCNLRMTIIKNTKHEMLARMWGKWYCYPLFVQVKVSAAIIEISMEVSQNTKSRTII